MAESGNAASSPSSLSLVARIFGGDYETIVPNFVFGIILAWMIQKLIKVILSFREGNLKLDWDREAVSPDTDADMKEKTTELEAKSDMSDHHDKETRGMSDISATRSRNMSSARTTQVQSEERKNKAGEKKKGRQGDEDEASAAAAVAIDDDDGYGVSDDDDDAKSTTEIEDVFDAAATYVAAMVRGPGVRASQETQLLLYGLFKQASFGPAAIANKPPVYSVTQRAKWEAWNQLGDMTKEEAMSKYVSVLTEVDEGWRSLLAAGSESASKSDGAQGRNMGPVFSTLQEDDVETEDHSMEMALIHIKASEGDIDGVMTELAEGVSVNLADEKKRTPLHWASDRGHVAVVNLLLARGANPNLQDSCGQTPFHYAVLCDYESVAKILWEHDADPSIKDEDGSTPYEMMSDTWQWRPISCN